MRPAVVQHENGQAGGEGLREGVAEEVEPLGVQGRSRQQEPIPRDGRHGTIDVAPRDHVLDGSYGLYPARREAPPADGQEAEAAVVLTEHPHRMRVRRGDDLLEAFSAGGQERGHGLRLFGGDWGAALGAGASNASAPVFSASCLEPAHGGLGQPLAQGFLRGEAVGTAEGLLQAGAHGWRAGDRFARGDVRRLQRLPPPGGIAREPAADRVTVPPQKPSDSLTVLGRPSRQQGEHVQAGLLMAVRFMRQALFARGLLFTNRWHRVAHG